MSKKKKTDAATVGETYEASKPAEEKYEASKSRTYLVTNRQNGPNEIIAGRFRKRLEPRGKEGDTCEISEQIYLHKDFISQRKYFVIKEK